MFLASIIFLSNRCTVKKVHYHVCEQILHAIVVGFIFLCIICLNISSCELMLNLEVLNQVLVTYDVNFLTNQREPNLMMINNDVSTFSFIFVLFLLFFLFSERRSVTPRPRPAFPFACLFCVLLVRPCSTSWLFQAPEKVNFSVCPPNQ